MNRYDQRPAVSRGLDASGKRIQRRAAEWLALQQARGLTLTEQADFAEWIARDSRHAAIFAEVESSWQTLDRLAGYPHSIDLAADPDLLAPTPAGWRRRVVRLPIALAAAAAIAMGGIHWFGRSFVPDTTVPATAGLPANARFMRLPDGSTVELNAGSLVTEHFTSTQRRLRLVRGEAHFSVAKDSTREFIVEADGVAVRAIGTAFNVRLQGRNVEVLVTEGTVRVAPPAAPTLPPSTPSPGAARLPDSAVSATLTAGQRTVVSAAAGPASPLIETLAAADIDRALAWQTSRFKFEATPLSEVVRQLNRYSAGQKGAPHLTIRDAPLGALLISGRVRIEQIESFVEALESSFGVVAERRVDGEILLGQSEREAIPAK